MNVHKIVTLLDVRRHFLLRACLENSGRAFIAYGYNIFSIRLSGINRIIATNTKIRRETRR